MAYKILVTGGAGFIGSFLVDKLVQLGHDVTIYDNLEPQVHQGKVPEYINKAAKFTKADVLDYDSLKRAVSNADIIFHQAAMVGVGQSMYQVNRYTSTNVMGTANLMDVLANEKHQVKKVIVAASMSSYGEGSYTCESCGVVSPQLRDETQLAQHAWELKCKCGKILSPIPTMESKPLQPNSVYAANKESQEKMLLPFCKAYSIPAVALRYFNVYGPRQSLSNPYTGVAAIFMSRIKNNNMPVIYEDGNQTRDFVSVHDIVQANILVMQSKAANYQVFNVGSGSARSIKSIAQVLAKLYGKEAQFQITNKFRKGDVRHCIADITKLSKLGYSPGVSFEEGMKELVVWSENQLSTDKVENATQELKDKGLME